MTQIEAVRPQTNYRSTRGMDAKLAREFERTFHVPLADYWQGILGFDVCGFDDNVLKSGDNQSMRDAIRQTYGVDAVILIERVLGHR